MKMKENENQVHHGSTGMAAVYVGISVPEIDAEGQCKQLEAQIQRCIRYCAQMGLASIQITEAAGSIKGY